MSQDDGIYEVHAIKYAHHARTAAENFLGGDPHDTAPMPLDYFVWLIRGRQRSFLLDTGFGPDVARRRDRPILRSPAEGLAMLGVDAAAIGDVIVSHMHYDHAGNHAMFAGARYHIQDREMAFCTGRCMCHEQIRRTFEAADVTAMVTRVFEGRACFHDGEAELAPGVSVHHVGGHSLGLQVVRVRTRRGFVVLASDATHFYAHVEQQRVFPIVADVPGVLEGYATLRRLASSADHIIPGHDPLVLARYPASGPGLEGIAARLDADPLPNAR